MTTPVPHTTVTYDVHDAAVAPMLTDASGGGAPTYGPWVDVPGIQSVSLDPELASAVLKGDSTTIARKGKIDSFTSQFTYSVLSLDVLGVIFGETVTDGGVDPDTTGTLSIKGNNSLPYFKAAFAIDDVSLGLSTVHVVMYKTQVTGGSIFSQTTDEFGTRNFTVSAIPALSDDSLVDIIFFESATDLQAAGA